jgi:hypothetical protein
VPLIADIGASDENRSRRHDDRKHVQSRTNTVARSAATVIVAPQHLFWFIWVAGARPGVTFPHRLRIRAEDGGCAQDVHG